jgi:hypothetical protein
LQTKSCSKLMLKFHPLRDTGRDISVSLLDYRHEAALLAAKP